MLIIDLRAEEAQISVLDKRAAEREAENRRLWGAMRATGELLRKCLLEDDERGGLTPFGTATPIPLSWS
jgi:hypothetical protein